MILIACEESQRVCKAFRDRGLEAFSCDVIEPSGNRPEWHIKQDVLPLLNGNCSFTTMDGTAHQVSGKWDMIIAFPPCTYLTNASACRLFKRIDGDSEEYRLTNIERLKNGILARDLFLAILNSNCDYVAIENPVPLTVFCLPQYSQIIQPYMFGEPFKKRTCLWLKGLPQLLPTEVVEPTGLWVNGGSKRRDGGGRYRHGVVNNQSVRSKTFEGIAEAMATQWGEFYEINS